MHPSSRSFVAWRSTDAPALLAGAVARQAMTPTARTQERLPARSRIDGPFAPAGGTFAQEVARSFMSWKDG